MVCPYIGTADLFEADAAKPHELLNVHRRAPEPRPNGSWQPQLVKVDGGITLGDKEPLTDRKLDVRENLRRGDVRWFRRASSRERQSVSIPHFAKLIIGFSDRENVRSRPDMSPQLHFATAKLPGNETAIFTFVFTPNVWHRSQAGIHCRE